MSRPILVVGASGKVGREVVRALLARAAAVRVLSRRADRSRLPEGVELAVGDLGRSGEVRAALAGIARVFFVTPHHPEERFLGESLVAACEAARVERLVFSSAMHPDFAWAPLRAALRVGMRAVAPHYVPKLLVEERVRRSPCSPVVLQPSNFFQNDDLYAEELRAGSYPQPIGARPVSRVDCADVGAAAARALLDDAVAPGAYPVVGPESLSGPDCARIWGSALGREVRYAGDDLDAWARLVEGRMPEADRRDYRRTYRLLQRAGAPAPARDVARTAALLGRAPRPFAAWAAERAARFRSEGGAPQEAEGSARSGA